MPDFPPQEEMEEDTNATKKMPKHDNKPTGAGSEFAFLDLFNGGGGSMAGVPSSSSGGDFDLSAFDEQFGMSKSQNATGSSDFPSSWQNPGNTSQNQSSSGGVDFSSLGNPKPKTNPMVIKPQQKPAQNQASSSTTTGTKSFKSLGNPFNASGQNQQNPKQNLDAFSFGNDQNQNQNANMFANMKVNKPVNTGYNAGQSSSKQSGWDNLDNELNSLTPADNASNFMENQNQGFNMGSNTNTGFNNQQAMNNQFQFNSGGNVQSSPYNNNNNQSGWDNLDLDLGGSATMGGQGQSSFNTNNMQSQQVKYNQGGFNQGKPNTQAGQFGFPSNNKTTKDPFSSSDDFFSSFDVQKPGQKKNTTSNFSNDLM